MNAKRFWLLVANAVISALISFAYIGINFIFAFLLYMIFGSETTSGGTILSLFFSFAILGISFSALTIKKIYNNHLEKEDAKTRQKCQTDYQPDQKTKSAPKERFSDPLFLDAVQLILESKIVSAGKLQSDLRIGSRRAVNLLNEMEELGIIGPAIGNLQREIFYSEEEWDKVKKNFEWCPKEPETTNSSTNPKVIFNSPMCASNCRCSRCGSSRILFDIVKERKPVGCFTIFLLVLFFFSIIGWCMIIYILLSRDETVTYATCQDCGNRWRTA